MCLTQFWRLPLVTHDLEIKIFIFYDLEIKNKYCLGLPLPSQVDLELSHHS